MSSELEFTLDSKLEADSVFVYDMPLCQVRMSKDANYPWFLLIPRIPDACEMHHLSNQQQQILTNESRILANAIEVCYAPDKLNVASLGNVVPQLHVHHIARFTHDLAWPSPVWGYIDAKVYGVQDYG